MAKLSIIVTAYNIECFIADCLDTILNQSLRDIEIIVVDDGSCDATPAIIREYAARDARIRPILFEANTIGGVASAANAGLDAATGEYIGFADGDDLYGPTMFEKLYEAVAATNADLAMCQYLELNDQNGEYLEPAERRRWLDVVGTQYVELTEATRPRFLKFIAVPWRKIYRRRLIEDNKLRFPIGDYFYEDNPFHWFSIITAKSIVLVPEVLCYHRIARVGQTMSVANEGLFRIFQHHETIHNWLKERGAESVYCTELLGWAVSQLEWISRRTPRELQPRLFESVKSIIGGYKLSEIEVMIANAGKGKRTKDMVLAIHEGSFSRFQEAVDDKPMRHSLPRAGLYHLRHHGFISTARITLRFLSNQMGFRSRATDKAEGIKENGFNNSDLMFALIILQRQLEETNRRLSCLEEQRGNNKR